MKYNKAAYILLLGAFLIQQVEAEPLRIRSNVEIQKDTVSLGDLIDGVPSAQNIALFSAPPIGGIGTIKVERIIEAATEVGISEVIKGDVQRTTITRTAHTFTIGEIDEVIRKGLANRGEGERFDLNLDPPTNLPKVGNASLSTLKMASFTYDPKSNRFDATLSIENDNKKENLNVVGSAIEKKEIIMLSGDLQRSDLIDRKDIVVAWMPTNKMPIDVVTSADEAIGMVLRKNIKAGETLRKSDIAKPMFVEKNQLITVIYNAKGLTVSMRARAQSNGAKGDSISVQNLQSKRLFEAIITGQGQASVLSPPASSPSLAEASFATAK